mgnify:CR=1 FL=1
MSTRRWLAILPLFALSGVSGVVYQVLWVRQFGLAFGNTTYSAAVVTAAFMSGLGLGSWYGGDARNGEGILIDKTADGRAFVAWFTYRPR